jgi:hypothetical protein
MVDFSPQHEAILEQRFARTESGEEVLLRAGRLERRHATVLRLLDGRVSGAELAAHLSNFDLPTILAALQSRGLIEALADVGARRSTRARWRLFGRRDRAPKESDEAAPEDDAPSADGGTDAGTPDDDSTRRLRAYLKADLDDDEITDIMGTARNV